MAKKQLRNLLSKEELERRMAEDPTPRTTLSFYQYANIDVPGQFRDQLYAQWIELGVLGRVYVAKEGINGQISLPTENILAFREALYAIPFLSGIRLNIAIDADAKSFLKLKIKVRKKIVADGLDDASFDVTKRGKHLSATEVNDLLAKEDTLIVDMRNHYESEVGYFKGAICPEVDTFREALPVVEEMLKDEKEKNIIMYCTGGIRCEKASAYYLHRGFKKVHMIDGGIIEYTRQCQREGLENLYVGKNFVFDERMAERISKDIVANCHQCGKPADIHKNCANDACHILFIQCEECATRFNNCCSNTCKDFIALPEEERRRKRLTTTFNGSEFSKSRKSARKGALKID
ncbi:MAG: rhodanese-related sulfurtransferase [Bacteroidota bacterium]